MRSMKALPEVIVYDVELTRGLPPAMSLASGIHAIAHTVEALYTKDGTPVTGARRNRESGPSGARPAPDRCG